MKNNIILTLSFILFSHVSFAQVSAHTRPSLYEGKYQEEIKHYLSKHKKQQSAAWILLGGGFLLNTVGSSLAMNSYEVNSGYQVLSTVGGLATIASVPMFFASTKNKNQAQQFYFQQKIDLATSEEDKNSYAIEASDYFISKARGNTITGGVLSSVGAIFVILAVSESNRDNNDFIDLTSVAYTAAGIGYGAMSIPFFVRGAKLRNMGRTILKTGRIPIPELGSLTPTLGVGREYVAIGLKMKF